MESPHQEQIDRILEKLRQVRAQFPDDLGAETHRYELNPPIKEQVLLDFEAEQGIRLPEEYRDFLLHAGNGGAGPYYGIAPFEKTSDICGSVHDGNVEDDPSLPCPLYFRMKRTDDWESEFGGVDPYQGTLYLGSQGCAYSMLLIVTGEYRGRVVYIDEDGQTPFVTYEPDFLTWYERWLDELLAGYELGWFGIGMGGSEAELLALLKNPKTTVVDKADALSAFWRFRDISAETLGLIPTFLSESDPEIRVSACRMICHFKLRNAEEAVAEQLSDPAPELRQTVIFTLMKFDSARWSEKVFWYLHDDDQAVTETAFQSLWLAKQLSRSDLLDLILEPPNEKILRSALYHIKWEPEDQELLLRLLEHQSAEIRYAATLGLRDIRAWEAIETVIAVLEHETDTLVRGSLLQMLGELDSVASRETLLEWMVKGNEVERMHAYEGLHKLGDERAKPLFQQLKQEKGHATQNETTPDESASRSRPWWWPWK